MPLRSPFRIVSLALASVALMGVVDGATAQEPPASPRTPMAPGSAWPVAPGPTWMRDHVLGMNRVPSPADGIPSPTMPTMAPPHFGGFGSTIRRGPAPDLAAQEATAIDELRGKKADVVVLSRATAHLILQLYRPDQNQWQEYQLAPLKPTSISCQPCNGKLRFAFSDGANQRQMEVEVPSLLRVFPDATTNQWRWDSFKLVFASAPEEPSQPLQPQQ